MMGGAAKAWVNFTSVTTTTIAVSFNMGSLTDNGTGDTTTSIIAPFSSSTYGVSGLAGGTTNTIGLIDYSHGSAKTTTANRLYTFNNSFAAQDAAQQNNSHHGTLA